MRVSTVWSGRLAAQAVAIVAILALAVVLAHEGADEARATGDGDFTAEVTIVIAGEEIPCRIEGSLDGGSTRIRDAAGNPREGYDGAGDPREGYDVVDNLTATGQCRIGEVWDTPDTEEQNDLYQRNITGVLTGQVIEVRPNSNGRVDGISRGVFRLSLTVDSDAFGQNLTTAPDAPLLILCGSIDLGDGLTAEPISYPCVLNTDRMRSERGRADVGLFASEELIQITQMTVEFSGVTQFGPVVGPPAAGFPPEAVGTSGFSGLIIALAAAGAMLVAGAGVFAIRRR